MFHTWCQLESSLLNFKQLLEKRSACEDSITNLGKENNELRYRLSELMESDINDKLIFPPTSTCAS